MGRLVLASILVLLIAAPLLAASDPHPIRAVKRLLLYVLLVHLAYAFTLRVIYPRV